MRWILVAVAAVVFGLAGAVGSAEAANTASCDGCHGADGKGKGKVPKISGMSTKTFISKMNAYKSGAKKNAAKNAIAKKLSDADIASLAAHYASK
ncbi:MAG: c-type cytochrome [Hyphomicrobiales bacterium]|nr:c-type cytochrome [Hyphomicrobiales bacterium]